MLETLDGQEITRVPRQTAFRALTQQLGADRCREIREYLYQIIEEMEPAKKTGLRTFSSSHLGSNLSPWPYPLKHLYDVAWEMEGADAPDEHIEQQSGYSFGLFVWECIMNRDERWVFYDPNLSSSDPNREITGKVYFEKPNLTDEPFVGMWHDREDLADSSAWVRQTRQNEWGMKV